MELIGGETVYPEATIIATIFLQKCLPGLYSDNPNEFYLTYVFLNINEYIGVNFILISSLNKLIQLYSRWE